MINQAPKVSVILPTYNRAYIIEKSIQSVLNQTYQDFEIIVIDDGSIDNTEEIIKELQEKDNRIRYLRLNINKGASHARNEGIKIAQGEYITFQDSDAEWMPEKLEKQIKAIENNLKIIYTGLWRIEGGNKYYIPDKYISQKEGYIYKKLLKGGFVDTVSLMVNKECFKKVGVFDEKLPLHEDWDLAIRLSKYYEFKLIDEPLFISQCYKDSISLNQDAKMKAIELIYLKYHNEINRDIKLRKSWSFLFNNVAKLYLKKNNNNKARQLYWRAIKLYPIWRGNYIDLIKYLLKKN